MILNCSLPAALWIRIHFFRIRIHKFFFGFGYGFGFLDSYFDPKFFQMVLLIAFICVLEPVRQRQNFPIEKHNFFLFQVFDLRFFTRFFILQQCPDPDPNPNFLFGFGSSQNFRILSDSDLQHYLVLTASSPALSATLGLILPVILRSVPQPGPPGVHSHLCCPLGGPRPCYSYYTKASHNS
jgi:hypothetical protein